MTFRQLAVPDLSGLTGYMNEISRDHCPFIGPSANFGAMHHSVYCLEGTLAQIESSLFYLGVLHTEILRSVRAHARANVASLSCENLFFRFSSEDEVDGRELFAWPHWLLKLGYTEKGVLFGKFWIGEKENSRSNQPIPAPPYHLLSVRSAITSRDPQFFKKAPELIEELVRSCDDKGEVFDLFAGAGVTLPADMASLTHLFMMESCARLQASGMYERLKAEQMAILQEEA